MKHTPTTTTVDYFLNFAPDAGFSGRLDEEAAARRHYDHEPYVIALPNRVVVFGPDHATVQLHSLGEHGPRGSLSYERHRDTGRYRLRHFEVYGRNGETVSVDVSPWGGTGRLQDSRSNEVREHNPPDEWLREVPAAAFGIWDGIMAMAMDPERWTKLPDGFEVRR